MANLPRANELRRVALVTGACSGLGRVMAGRLASLGYELVIVSHRQIELKAASRKIAAAHGVRVHPVVLDLARPEAAAELHAAVAELGLEVDVLVNNAGLFFFGEAVGADPARANAMLQLHVVTPSLVCTLFGRDMRERGRGHILIVSSLSAWGDFPGIAYYGSSKKYLLGFTRALRSEMRPYGVHVTCLAPGGTATSLYDMDAAALARAKRLGFMMDAETVAEAGLKGLFEGRAEVLPGTLTKLMLLGTLLTPRWVVNLSMRWAPWRAK